VRSILTTTSPVPITGIENLAKDENLGEPAPKRPSERPAHDY